MPVSGITEKGAKFNAELYSLGTEKIIEHGFVWNITANPTINYSNKILLGQCDSTGIFSTEILTSLKKDVKYTVKSFVQTSDHLVYGVPVEFRSLGSGAPTITSFEPLSAEWMDTLIIRGKNFSWVTGENVVKLNQTVCQALSSTDTTLRVLINSDLPDLKSIVSIDLAGNVAVNTKDTFRLIAPVIKDFYPKEARWGDTLFIKGKHINLIPSKSGNYIKLENLTCSFLKYINDSIIAVRVPDGSNSISNSISGLLNGIYLSNTTKFNLLSPEITSFYPKKGLRNSIITIYGKFHPLQTRSIIALDNVVANITYYSKDSIKLRIPSGTGENINIFTCKSPPFESTFNDLFEILHPVINSINPLLHVSMMR